MKLNIVFTVILACCQFLSASVNEAEKLFKDSNYKECYQACTKALENQSCKSPDKYLALISELRYKVRIKLDLESLMLQTEKRFPKNPRVTYQVANYYKDRNHDFYMLDGVKRSRPPGIWGSSEYSDNVLSLKRYEKLLTDDKFVKSIDYYNNFIEVVDSCSNDYLEKSDWLKSQITRDYINENIGDILSQRVPKMWNLAENDWQRIYYLHHQATQLTDINGDVARYNWADFLESSFCRFHIKMVNDELMLYDHDSKKVKLIPLPDQYNFIKIYKELMSKSPVLRPYCINKIAEAYHRSNLINELIKFLKPIKDELPPDALEIYENYTMSTAHFYKRYYGSKLYLIHQNCGKVNVRVYKYDLAKAWNILTTSVENGTYTKLFYDAANCNRLKEMTKRESRLKSTVKLTEVQGINPHHYGYGVEEVRSFDGSSRVSSKLNLEKFLIYKHNELKTKVSELSFDFTGHSPHQVHRKEIDMNGLGQGIYFLESEQLNGRKAYTLIRKFDHELHHLSLGDDYQSWLVGINGMTGDSFKSENFKMISFYEDNEKLLTTGVKTVSLNASGMTLYGKGESHKWLYWTIAGEPYLKEFSVGYTPNLSRFHDLPEEEKDEDTFDSDLDHILDDMEEFEPTPSELWLEKYKSSLKWLATASQPIYQPGQIIKASVWLVDEEAIKNMPNDASINITLPGSNNFRKEQNCKINKNGQFDVEFPLSKNVSSGNLHLFSRYAGGAIIEIPVECYRKPNFVVKVIKSSESSKKRIFFDIGAKYYNGAPVVKGTFSYKVTFSCSSRYRWNDPKRFYNLSGNFWEINSRDGFYSIKSCFGPIDVGESEDGKLVFESSYVRDQVIEGVVELENGQGNASVEVPKRFIGMNYNCTIDYKMTNQSNQRISGEEALVVRRDLFFRSNKPYYDEDEAISIHLANDQNYNVKLYRITYTNENIVQSTLCESLRSEFHAQLDIKNPGAGKYRLVFENENGYPVHAYGFIVQGKFNEINKTSFRPLELTSEKHRYTAGDQVEIVIASKLKSSIIHLYWLSSTKEIKHKKVRTENHTAVTTVPVHDKLGYYFPVFALTAKDFASSWSELLIQVKPKNKSLTLVTDLDKEKYKPGEDGRLEIKLNEENCTAKETKVLVAIYDESLDALVGEEALPLLDQLMLFTKNSYSDIGSVTIGRFGNHPLVLHALSAAGYLGNCFINDKLWTDSLKQVYVPTMWDFRNNYRDNGLPCCSSKMDITKPKKITVRKNFQDALLWKWVTLDENGKGSCQFKVPDNLTSWKVKTYYVSPAGKVGEAETVFEVNKPLMIQLQPPRFMVEKDQLEVSAIISNMTPSEITSKVSLEMSKGFVEIVGKKKHEVKIKNNSQTVVTWTLKATKAGVEQVTVRAIGKRENDAETMNLPIKIYGSEVRQHFPGVLSTSSKQLKWRFDLPKDVRVGSEEFGIIYQNSLSSVVVDSLLYLCEYPHGCVEQTVNKFVPLVLAQKIIKKYKIEKDGLPTAEMRSKLIESGLGRLKYLQGPEGGWSWFGAQNFDPYMTAVVLNGLIGYMEARPEADFDLVYNASSLLNMCLDQIVNSYIKVEVSDQHAFIAYVYSRSLKSRVSGILDKKLMNKAINNLYEKRSKLSLVGKLYLALASEGARKIELRRNIEQFLEVDKLLGTAYLKTKHGYSWSFDHTETQALYLKLLVQMESNTSKILPVITYLLRHRQHANYWKSTRDTAMVVEAFLDFLEKFPNVIMDSTFEVWLDNKLIKKVDMKGGVMSKSGSIEVDNVNLTAGTHNLQIKHFGEGLVYLSGQFSYFSTAPKLKSYGDVVKVKRRFFRVKDGMQGELIKDGTQISVNEEIEVELLIDASESLEYLLLTDHKPAGFETVAQKSGYLNGENIYAYMDIRDSVVNLFIDKLPQEKSRLTYRIRAEHAGTVTALPAKIEAMYTPAVNAGSRGECLKVK